MPSGQAPKIDSSTGKLSGEAKFLSFGDGSNSSWNGLVDLSDISYNPSTGNFGGQTPTTPVNVLGQMSWCGSSYCVTTANVTGGNQWPTNVTIPSASVTSNGFTVQWTNPQSYKQMGIYLFSAQDPNFNICPSSTPNPANNPSCYQSYPIPSNLQSALSATGTQTLGISGLNASTTYNIFIRGLLQ